MTQLIDRRQNAGKKSTVNRQRFLRRYKKQIKQAVSDATGSRKITDIAQGKQITIPAKDIAEPRFHRGEGGKAERILPGNDIFNSGDRVQRPNQGDGEGKGSQASNEGEGDDDFVFQISREEFLEIYFEDLELPDLVKKELTSIPIYKTVRTGFTSTGVPTNINVSRSMRQATGRRVALASHYKQELRETEAALHALLEKKSFANHSSSTSSRAQRGIAECGTEPSSEIPRCARDDVADEKEIVRLQEHAEYLRSRIRAIPFIDTIDLRYNNRVRVQVPSTQAVMFCVMDVSGSMDEAKKDIAKRFFILLYLFLTRNYKKIDLVFIRHHTSAKEVSEEDFFYSRETGGTVVSSALELLHQTIEARYHPAAWNIYVAQASDGDNWNADSPYCKELLQEKIMPLLQYFAYIEIMPRHHQSLWEVYQTVHEQCSNFAMENIDTVADIYPVFHALFKRKVG